MAASTGLSELRKPWAWLAAIAAFGLALASSTALFVVNPAVKVQLPWWAAVAAPALVYGLVLPLRVPSIRMGGWLRGFFTLVILHVGTALATAWLYARVGLISFEQALAPALWGFPPALVLAMVGSVVLTLPFLGALTPRAVARRLQVDATPPLAETTMQPRHAPEIIPSKDRQAWARTAARVQRPSAAPAAVAQPAMVGAPPKLAEPVPPPAEAGVHAAAPVVEATVQTSDELVAAEPSSTTAVRIPFDRVVEQLPPPEPADAERLAALLAPSEAAALEAVQVGEFAIISVSATGLSGSDVSAAAGRLSSLIARRASRPVEQATLRAVGGTLVLTPVGSGWNTGTALAVALRPGDPLAHLEALALRAAAARDPGSLAVGRQPVTPAPRFEDASTPRTAAEAVEDLEAFGPLTVQSYREPTSGALIHCFVSPGTSAAELAPFAWELAQVMAQGAQGGALGSFHSAVLRSAGERLEIRRLESTTGLVAVLVVAGADTGRPGLAHRQVERTAARLSGA